MKQQVTFEQIVELSPEHIISLAEQEPIKSTWEEFSTVEHAAEGIKAYKEKGYKYNSLVELSDNCTIGKLLELVALAGTMEVKQIPVLDKDEWRVTFRSVFSKEEEVVFEGKELVDQLFAIVKNEVL